MKALIVEDNDEARKLLGELLKQSGFEVFEAENGKKALEILKEKKDFDIIISDVLMPVMDGFKFCYEVKSNPELNFIPFVFYTGSYISAEDKMFGLKLGADDYITKPIKFEALLERINKAIERKGIRKPVAEFEEATYLKEYNERLIHKLEEKLIELNQAYEQIKEKNKELETINLILTAINSTKNIKHLLKQISKPFSEIFDADAVNFFIFDRTKNCLKLVFSFTKLPDENIFEKYPELPIGDDFATEIINQKLIIYHNISKGSTNVREEIFKSDFNSFVEVALRVRDKFIGSIELAFKRDDASLDESKISILDMLAQQIAIEIDNLTLFSELKESEEKYRTFIHLTPAGLIVIDDKMNILFSSQKANDIFNCELEGKNLKEFLNSSTIEQICKHDFEQVEKTFEATYNGKFLLISATKKLDDPKLGKCILVVNDISDFKRLQEEKRKVEAKLWQEYRLASIGRLAGGIAHNLKNPLAVLNLGLQSLKRRGVETEQVERLLKQVERINQIIENLSLKTREEIEKNKKRFDLNQLLQRELETLEFDPFYKHQVEKVFQFSERPIVIEAVYSDFSSAFSHILRNAIDAMLETERKVLTVKTWEDDQNIYVEIIDTGVGMTEEIKDKIFEPFFTTKTSDNFTGIKGVGLGLTITYQNLKRYGADFEIESKIGKGTRFKVIIPKRNVGAV